MAAPAGVEGFASLQTRLQDLWPTIRTMTTDAQTIVVLPSMSVDVPADIPDPLVTAYEDRSAYLLLLLQQPNAHLVFVGTEPLADEVVDYHLRLLPTVSEADARRRLTRVGVGGSPHRPLAARLLERDDLLEPIRRQVAATTGRAHLVPFLTTPLEQRVAVALDIPVYGTDPGLSDLGTKSGARELFRRLGVALPVGVERVRSLDELTVAIAEIRRLAPGVPAVVVKLDDGFGGFANASLDVSVLPAPGSAGEGQAIRTRLGQLRPADGGSAEAYLDALARVGGVVEERIEGDGFASPSVQLRIDPFGNVELLSTHDQLLGGPEGSAFLGAVFPADPDHAAAVIGPAMVVGEALATAGALGRFAIDFVVVRRAGRWHPYAIEINLRKGGTTHPFLSLQWLTDGRYDPDEGALVAADGRRFAFVTSDHVEAPGLARCSVADVAGALQEAGLAFRPDAERGAILNMLGGLPVDRCGVTFAAPDVAEARIGYDRAVQTITTVAAQA